jgi:hypothetical protein
LESIGQILGLQNWWSVVKFKELDAWGFVGAKKQCWFMCLFCAYRRRYYLVLLGHKIGWLKSVTFDLSQCECKDYGDHDICDGVVQVGVHKVATPSFHQVDKCWPCAQKTHAKALGWPKKHMQRQSLKLGTWMAQKTHAKALTQIRHLDGMQLEVYIL